jgi:hypothetical protein
MNKNKKRKRLVQPRQALEGLTVKSLFDFIGRTETSRGARRWSWIKKTTYSNPQLNQLYTPTEQKRPPSIRGEPDFMDYFFSTACPPNSFRNAATTFPVNVSSSSER